MKFIHTSDWHIGHVLYNYPRGEEFRSMVDSIVEIVRQHQPDAFLISGDVYDTATPSNASERFFTDSMVRIHNACPDMKIVVTAGNHDSATGHEIFRNAWEAHNVITVGRPPRVKEELDNCIVYLPGKAYVAAMPYANANFKYLGCKELLERVSQLNRDALPVVLMAHTTVKGSDFRSHQKIKNDEQDELTIGSIEAISLDELGEGYDYCALGHIHNPQTIHGSKGKVRYSGTPMAISFDEVAEHSVTLVEIDGQGCEPAVTALNISPKIPLETIPCDIDGNPQFTDWNSALQMLREFHPGHKTYVRLNVAQECALPTNADHSARQAADENVLFCTINFEFRRNPSNKDKDSEILTASEFKRLAPIDIARRYYEDKGMKFGDEEVRMFNEAISIHEQKIRHS